MIVITDSIYKLLQYLPPCKAILAASTTHAQSIWDNDMHTHTVSRPGGGRERAELEGSPYPNVSDGQPYYEGLLEVGTWADLQVLNKRSNWVRLPPFWLTGQIGFCFLISRRLAAP